MNYVHKFQVEPYVQMDLAIGIDGQKLIIRKRLPFETDITIVTMAPPKEPTVISVPQVLDFSAALDYIQEHGRTKEYQFPNIVYANDIEVDVLNSLRFPDGTEKDSHRS